MCVGVDTDLQAGVANTKTMITKHICETCALLLPQACEDVYFSCHPNEAGLGLRVQRLPQETQITKRKPKGYPEVLTDLLHPSQGTTEILFALALMSSQLCIGYPVTRQHPGASTVPLHPAILGPRVSRLPLCAASVRCFSPPRGWPSILKGPSYFSSSTIHLPHRVFILILFI